MKRRASKEGSTFQFLVALPTALADQLDGIAAKSGATRMALVRSAIETFIAERGGEKLSVDLPGELRIDLAAFAEVFYDAPVQNIVIRALQEHIEKMIQPRDFRGPFEEARKKILTNGNAEDDTVIVFRRTRMS